MINDIDYKNSIFLIVKDYDFELEIAVWVKM